MRKLFSLSLKDKAWDWHRLLDNSHLLNWQELMSLFYAKFNPLHEIHLVRNYIYNFWSRDGESIAKAWGRLKSLMLKCPNHELPRILFLQIFNQDFFVKIEICLMPLLAGHSQTKALKLNGI